MRGAHIAYAVKNRVYPDSGDKRSTWRIGLFGCLNATDSGFSCCCAYWCCAPCTWSIAMKGAGIEGTETVVAAAVLNSALSSQSESGAGNTASTIANVVRVSQAVKARSRLYRKLYGTVQPESDLVGYFYHCCCPACAYIQEVDAIMTYSAENQGRRLVYGSFPLCAQLYFADTGGVVSEGSIDFEKDESAVSAPLIMLRM